MMDVIATTRLTSLPLELLFIILTYLTPIDLISFRQTCRHHNAATQNPSVWRTLFREICRASHVFKPTFAPIERMGLRQLERLALTPQRWLQTLHSGKSGKPHTLPSAVLKAGKPRTLGAGMEHVVFVPGGRFLVWCRREIGAQGLPQECFVMLWDLGTPRSEGDETGSRLVATRFLGVGWIDDHVVVCSTADGEGLRVGVPWGQSMDDVRVSVFDIFPGRENPVFEEIAVLCLTAILRFANRILIDATRLVVYEGRRVVVWDFLARTWASWTTEGMVPHDFELILNGPLVLRVTMNSTKIWVIPPSTTHRPSLAEPATFPLLLPVFEIQHAERCATRFSLVPSCWYQSQHTVKVPLTYVQVSSSNNYDPNPAFIMHLDSIVVNGDLNETSSYLYSTKIITRVSPSCTAATGWLGIAFQDQTVVAMWQDSFKVVGMLAHGPDDPPLGDLIGTGVGEDSESAFERGFGKLGAMWEVGECQKVVGFCPVFGRVVSANFKEGIIVPYELV